MTGHGARGAGLNGMGEDNRQVSEKGMNGAHLSSCEQDSSALETAARKPSCTGAVAEEGGGSESNKVLLLRTVTAELESSLTDAADSDGSVIGAGRSTRTDSEHESG